MNKKMLGMVFGISLLATMGISSLLPSLPHIALQYGLPVESSWRIIAAFALPGLFCVPFVGVLADRFGRKQVLIPSLLLFALGGCACMAAQSFAQLLLCRMVQGVGSAPLGLLYATIIADAWQGEERLKVMSWNAFVLGLGTAVSPALGGMLAMLHWKLPFALPLLALPLALLAASLPLLRPLAALSLKDYAKQTLSCAREPRTLVLFSLTLLTFIMLSGPIITCLPMLAELTFHASPLETGMVIAIASLASGLAAARLPRLHRRLSIRRLLLIAVALYSVAFCAIALTTSFWLLLGPVTLYGLAQGLNIPLVNTLLTGQAPDGQRAALMACNAVLLRLGQNIGPAAFGALAACSSPSAAIAAGTLVALGMAAVTVWGPLPAPADARAKTP